MIMRLVDMEIAITFKNIFVIMFLSIPERLRDGAGESRGSSREIRECDFS